MTARGMQELGLIYVLAPALRHLYPDPRARARAFARYAEHSNTHVFMFPGYAGLLISMESQIAAGSMPEAVITSLRQTLATTLSALGDGFFSGAVRTLWALIAICLILLGSPLAAAVWTLALLLLLTVFRFLAFFYCLRHGITSLQWLRRLDVVSWTERIKIFNAVLIACMLWLMLGEQAADWPLEAKAGIFLFIPAAAWLVGRLHIPRTLLWFLALCFFALLEGGYVVF